MGRSKSLCSDEIRNIFGRYVGQICSDLVTDGKFGSSDRSLSHFHDTAFGETTVSETDIEVENERTAGL
jgi:hypothetical protein